MKFPQTGKIEHTFGEHVFGGWGAVVKCENAPYRAQLCDFWGFLKLSSGNRPIGKKFTEIPIYNIKYKNKK